jgi:beta-glucosidase
MTRPHSALLASLDLRAKIALLTGASAFALAADESIGLREIRLSDGPTGVRGDKLEGGPSAALLPNATLLASAWSECTAYEVGRLLAEEAMAQQVHVVLGPTINLHRSPLGGRLFEAYSEDPLLTGTLAAAYVRGLQDGGVGACLKHLVANESETERNTVDIIVDQATLRELYLLPFEIAVADGDAWSIMAAYNDVNGVAATEQHQVNNEIVKGEWGYAGLIMSDWYATKSAGPAANGGLDLVMPGPRGPWGDALVAAVESGEVPESVIDDHLGRLLLLADRVGALGTPRPLPEGLPAPDSPERSGQLRRLAADGMTVLVNRGAALPLRRQETVALIGRHALETVGMGGGSARVNPPHQSNVADGLTAVLGDAVTVVDGVEVRTRPVATHDGVLSDPVTGRPGVRFTLLAGDGSIIEERHSARATTVVGFDDDFSETVATVRFRARLDATGRIELSAIGAGDWTIRAGGQELAYALRVSGSGFAEEILAPPVRTSELAVAGGDIIDGSVDLRPAADGHVAAGTAAEGIGHPGLGDPFAGVGLLGVVARPAPRDHDDVIADAVAAARAADVAVVVVGLTEEQETEAADKSTLRLPGRQDELVAAVAAAARRTVVVVNAATPALMPWLDQVDAVLWAGLPGQEGGHAVAAALLGDIEPAGRLVTTFPAADGAAPAWSVTPVDGRLEYVEGTFIGYRGHHADHAPAPTFWFGHGLGYTTWRYDDARLVPGESPGVAVTLTNTGERDGREVVQVYFDPEEPDQPVRLVGWGAVRVAAGRSASVEVRTDPRLWRRWDTDAGRWGTLSGAGWLHVARGLGDIRHSVELVVG